MIDNFALFSLPGGLPGGRIPGCVGCSTPNRQTNTIREAIGCFEYDFSDLALAKTMFVFDIYHHCNGLLIICCHIIKVKVSPIYDLYVGEYLLERALVLGHRHCEVEWPVPFLAAFISPVFSPDPHLLLNEQ